MLLLGTARVVVVFAFPCSVATPVFAQIDPSVSREWIEAMKQSQPT